MRSTRANALASRSLTAAVAALTMAIAAVMLAASADATTWPQRTVKFILPIGPGSGADIGARLFADRLAKRWAQPVIVENRPGGDAVTGITAFISANDDHTLLLGPTGTFTAHPYQHAKLAYDRDQLVPVARISNTVVVISTPVALHIDSLDALVALARKEPGKLNWAAITGLNDFQFQSFVKTERLGMVRVPYRDGVQALNDLAENRIQVYASAYAVARPQIEAGKIRVIAVSNTQRAETVLPGVPTAREAGYPALEFDGLVGIFCLPMVPVDVRERIARDVIELSTDPVVVDRLTATGQLVNPGTPAEFVKSIEHQRAGAAETARVLGLKAAD